MHMASTLAIKTPLLVGVEKRNYGGFKSMQPALKRSSSSYNFNSRNKTVVVKASGGKKIKTNAPYGINGGLSLEGGVDASGRRAKGKGVYQFVDKYGANVDGYSPIYSPEEWSPSGDVYVGGKSGLVLWAITLAGLLAGGALLVYNTSALAQ